MNPTLDLCSTRIRGQARVDARARPIATGLVLAGADAAGLMAAAALATSLWLLVNPAAGGYYGMWSTAPLFLVAYAVLGFGAGMLSVLTGHASLLYLGLAGILAVSGARTLLVTSDRAHCHEQAPRQPRPSAVASHP